MFRIWFIAMRPWSFTAAFIPIALGSALAWSEGTFSIGLFLLTLFGGVCMQAGTNLINTYGDYMAGVDTIESARTCPQLVAGVLKPDSMRRAGLIAFSLAGAIGFLLSYLCGPEVLVVGVIGLLGGYCYTAGAWPYKYQGLGPLFVFFLMGPLMTWPAYFIQTGQFTMVPIAASIPVGFLVTGIIHANDLRDIMEDRKAGIKTVALHLGFGKSVVLYAFLYAAAYACLVLFIFQGWLPGTAILPLLLMPMVLTVLRRAFAASKGAYEQLSRLEADSAGLHFQFGLLLITGLLAAPYVGRWWL